MLKRKITTSLCGAAAVIGLLSPTAAMAGGTATPYSPLVALSMVAGPQSQAALCAVGASGATAAAESANQSQPVQGCVLPVPDAAAAPLPGQAAIPGTGFSPLLIGLGAIGLGVLLFALLHGDDNEAPPEPLSPA